MPRTDDGMSYGSVPTPDPTKLTTDAVNAAADNWRRELLAVRELIETRLHAMDAATDLRLESIHDEPQRMALLVTNLEHLHDEKFTSISLQFKERDIRTDQAAIASKQALDAALLAAKELVGQQNTANVEAAAKAETSFTKQIDQTSVLIATLEKALTDRILELKERMDRGEGVSTAVSLDHTERRDNRNEGRASQAVLLSAVAIVVAIIIAAATLYAAKP